MPNNTTVNDLKKYLHRLYNNISEQQEVNSTSSYTDEQNVLIAREEYENYKVGDRITIKTNGNPTTIGYVAEVIHKPSGEDTYVVTNTKLSKNPTPEELANIKDVTILYQGSTPNKKDWIDNDFPMANRIHSDIPSATLAAKTGNPNSTMPPKSKLGPTQQIKDASDTLESVMQKYPSAMVSIYGHSLGSMNGQYAIAHTQYPDRIKSAFFYNGPNIYSILTEEEQRQADSLKSVIFNYVDPHDIVPLGYNDKVVGQLFLLKSKDLGIGLKAMYDQHLWGGYVFDNFENLIDINGHLVSSYSDIRGIDINNDGIYDLAIEKNSILRGINIKSNDGSTIILPSLDLITRYPSSGNLYHSGIDIQLNPELLCTLVSNTVSDIEISLAIMLGICSLCITQNSKIKDNFEKRKTQVYESIQEIFRGCNIPLIFENLNASIEQFKKNSNIFDILSSPGTLLTTKFTSNEKLYSIGHIKYGFTVNDFNAQLSKLANESINIAELCNSEKCDEISSLSENQTVVIKSWKTVEDTQKNLLESSNQVFEGNGLRAGRNDAIQQSITDVLEVEEANIKELQNVISNLKTFMTITTLSFNEKDSSLGTSLQTSKDFSVSASVSGVPQSYEAYLNRSEIFNDVKGVLQAFDMQVEKNSKEYAKKVAEMYGESLGQFENSLAIWLELANGFKSVVNSIHNNFNYPVVVTRRYSFTYTLKGDSYTTYRYRNEYWGDLQKLYKSTVVDSIKQAVDKIFPLIPIISATLNSSKTAKNNLGNIEPELKKIIEDGVYKSIDLMEVVQSQKVILQLAVKCKVQIRFVIDSINNASMKGKAITAILTKLLQIERLFEYFSTFVSDCFGDNYNEEASSTAPQSSAANFSLNSFT